MGSHSVLACFVHLYQSAQNDQYGFYRATHMSSPQLAPRQAGQNISINSIKQDFIKLNQMDAANEQFTRVLADEAHVRQVKMWVQDQERELGIKVQVEACMQAAEFSAPGMIQKGNCILFASHINTHKQAMDAFEYVVVGLKALPEYMAGSKERICAAIFSGMGSEQTEYICKRFNVEHAQQGMMLYLAEVAGLNITPTFLERREGWQRSIMRKLYPKLGWTPTDIHCLIHRARNRIS